MNYNGLEFGRDELTSVMQAYYEELLDFVSTPAFRSLYQELMELAPEDRPDFVLNVVLNHEERERRGIAVPDGILIQTSAFGDRRPTLFAVKKFLPKKYHGAWENVNLTFFNEFKDDEIPRDPTLAWRPPLPTGLQNALLKQGRNLEDVPASFGINFDSFSPADGSIQEP